MPIREIAPMQHDSSDTSADSQIGTSALVQDALGYLQTLASCQLVCSEQFEAKGHAQDKSKSGHS
jgi:hypothetical protein